jgi:hypothetical protein
MTFKKSPKDALKKVGKIIFLLALVIIFFALDAVALLIINPSMGMVSLRNMVFPLLVFVASGLFILLIRSNFKAAIVFLVLLTIVDLARQGWKYNNFIDESLVFPNTKSLEFFRQQEVPPRVVMSHQELLPAEANVYYDFSLLGGYDSVHSAKVEKLLNTLNYQSVDSEDVSGRVVFVSSLTSRAYDILSPEYYLVLNDNKEKVGNNTELVFSEGRTEVYRNLDSYPRVYLTKEVEKVGEDEVLLKVLSMAESRGKVAYVTKDLTLSDEKLDGSAKLVLDHINNLQIAVDTSADAVVVINESFSPNWKAKNVANGQEIELFEVNYNLLGFKAPPGQYNVELVYSPKSFYKGVNISMFSLGLFVGYALLLKRKNS